MSDLQNRPTIGKNCRFAPAAFAGASAESFDRGSLHRARSRLPLFAQFPPAALFKAIGRAVSRRSRDKLLASGTVLATGRLWRARGGP